MEFLRDFTILDYMPVGAFVIDSSFTILHWNKCLTTWTSASKDSMVGQNLLTTYPRLQEPKYRVRFESLFQYGAPVIFSYHMHKYLIPALLPDGTYRRHNSIANAIRIPGNQTPVVLVTLQDVTEVHRRIQEASKLRDQTLQELELRKIAEAKLKESEDRLRRLATTDDLTGAPNRRKLMSVLKDELARSQRYNTDVSFLMLDVDNFKTINDTHGHAVGDEVLQKLVTTISGHLRAVDMAGRMGGEEFGIILPATDIHGANIFAERLRDLIDNTPVNCCDLSLEVTASIGVACNTATKPICTDCDELIKQADVALYKAKNDGRNCVHCFQE